MSKTMFVSILFYLYKILQHYFMLFYNLLHVLNIPCGMLFMASSNTDSLRTHAYQFHTENCSLVLIKYKFSACVCVCVRVCLFAAPAYETIERNYSNLLYLFTAMTVFTVPFVYGTVLVHLVFCGMSMDGCEWQDAGCTG